MNGETFYIYHRVPSPIDFVDRVTLPFPCYYKTLRGGVPTYHKRGPNFTYSVLINDGNTISIERTNSMFQDNEFDSDEFEPSHSVEFEEALARAQELLVI